MWWRVLQRSSFRLPTIRYGIKGLTSTSFGSDAYLRDTLLVLAAEENSPGDAARVLALKEQRLGLALLEAEDLGVTADKDLAL